MEEVNPVAQKKAERAAHQPSDEQLVAQLLEEAWAKLRACAPSRENALAVTKVQEAVMWCVRDHLIKNEGLHPDQPRLANRPGAEIVPPTVVEPEAQHRGPIGAPTQR